MKNTYRFLVAIFLTLGICSCSVERWCNDRYPPVTKDSTYTKKDTLTLYDTIYFPYESVSIDTSGVILESIEYHVKKKKGRLTSSVDISKGKLSFKCDADSLVEYIEKQNYKETTYREKKEVKTVTVIAEHWYIKPLIWWFCITFLIFIVWVVIKIIKIYTGKPLS